MRSNPPRVHFIIERDWAWANMPNRKALRWSFRYTTRARYCRCDSNAICSALYSHNCQHNGIALFNKLFSPCDTLPYTSTPVA